jgi:hypothetical protein
LVPLILNWFRARGEISNGAVEGLNNKIRVVTRRSYGLRTFDAMEIALYQTLSNGSLPVHYSATTTWDDSRNQNLPTDSAEEAFIAILYFFTGEPSIGA